MKITNVETFVLDTGKDYPDPTVATEAHGVRFISLLKITTDEGITGWSDIETQPHVAKAIVDAPSGGQIGFEGLRNALVGEDPLERERLWQKMYRFMAYYGRSGAGMHLISGADIALWDIAGKAFGQPVCKLLGAKYREHVKAYASTLFRPTPDDMKRACEGYLRRGFTAIKFGWGVFGQDRKRDLALVKAAREAIGPDVDLLVDAGWKVNRSAYDAISLLRDLEPYRIFWLEDFLHPECYEGYAAVKAAGVKTRLAAGEQEATAWGFHDLIHRGRVDVVQPDLSRCGGFTQFRKIAWEAERAGVDVCPHAWLTDLLTAASLHANAALPRSLFLEYNVSASPMLREIIADPIEMDADGFITVPQGAGLGVEVNEEAVGRYRIA